MLIDNRMLEELADAAARPSISSSRCTGGSTSGSCALIDRKAVVTPVTLKPYFESDEALEELGGTAYLARLTADGQGLLAPRELAEQIYDLALLRELITVGREPGHRRDGHQRSRSRRWSRSKQAEAALYAVAEGAQTGSEAQSFAHRRRAPRSA